jgi:hypothetical protein
VCWRICDLESGLPPVTNDEQALDYQVPVVQRSIR